MDAFTTLNIKSYFQEKHMINTKQKIALKNQITIDFIYPPKGMMKIL